MTLDKTQSCNKCLELLTSCSLPIKNLNPEVSKSGPIRLGLVQIVDENLMKQDQNTIHSKKKQKVAGCFSFMKTQVFP